MKGEWKEVIRIAFKGERFKDHALDLTALSELSHFQKLVADTAKELWRKANPQRERLPKNFEERTRLCLRRIEEGSAVAPLEVYIEQQPLFELSTEIEEAVDLAYETIRSLETNEPLPDKFPKSLLSEYARWGQQLEENDEIKVIRPGKEPTSLTPSSRLRLQKFADLKYEDYVDIVGEVLEADIRLKRFQLWTDEKTCVIVSFPQTLEDEVITALKDHNKCRLHIKGTGEFTAQGKLQRVIEIVEWDIQELGEIKFDQFARPIEEIIEELASEVPEEDWNKLPSDLTDNLDHYLYGIPKR